MRVLADIILIIHFGWILFIIAGLTFAIYWRDKKGIRITHLIGVIGGTLQTVLGLPCPLTIIENNFRSGSAYSGSCIVHYLGRVFIYIKIDPILVIQIIGIAVAMLTIILFMCYPPRQRKSNHKKSMEKDTAIIEETIRKLSSPRERKNQLDLMLDYWEAEFGRKEKSDD